MDLSINSINFNDLFLSFSKCCIVFQIYSKEGFFEWFISNKLFENYCISFISFIDSFIFIIDNTLKFYKKKGEDLIK
jgi:hypothetical protein